MERYTHHSNTDTSTIHVFCSFADHVRTKWKNKRFPVTKINKIPECSTCWLVVVTNQISQWGTSGSTGATSPLPSGHCRLGGLGNRRVWFVPFPKVHTSSKFAEGLVIKVKCQKSQTPSSFSRNTAVPAPLSSRQPPSALLSLWSYCHCHLQDPDPHPPRQFATHKAYSLCSQSTEKVASRWVRVPRLQNTPVVTFPPRERNIDLYLN